MLGKRGVTCYGGVALRCGTGGFLLLFGFGCYLLRQRTHSPCHRRSPFFYLGLCYRFRPALLLVFVVGFRLPLDCDCVASCFLVMVWRHCDAVTVVVMQWWWRLFNCGGGGEVWTG